MVPDSLHSLNMGSSEQIVINRIKRIIEKYPSVWRVIHEPVQNSIDAIQKRDDLDSGRISLSLDYSTNRVVIKDNGIGFPENFNLDEVNTMGLKLVRTLVENQLDGSVKIKNKNGTEFVIKFRVK